MQHLPQLHTVSWVAVVQSESRPHGSPGSDWAQQNPLAAKVTNPVQHAARHSSAVAHWSHVVLDSTERQVGLGQTPSQQRRPDPAAPQGVPVSGVQVPLVQVWHSGQLPVWQVPPQPSLAPQALPAQVGVQTQTLFTQRPKQHWACFLHVLPTGLHFRRGFATPSARPSGPASTTPSRPASTRRRGLTPLSAFVIASNRDPSMCAPSVAWPRERLRLHG
jgi:hypothetical protein